MTDETTPKVSPETAVSPVETDKTAPLENPPKEENELLGELDKAGETSDAGFVSAPAVEEPSGKGEATLTKEQAAIKKANKKAEEKAAKAAAKLASKKDLNFFQRTIKAGGNVARFTLGLPFVPFTYLFKGLGGMTNTEASTLNFFQRTIKAGGNVSRFVFGLPLRLLTGIFRGARGVANTGKK